MLWEQTGPDRGCCENARALGSETGSATELGRYICEIPYSTHVDDDIELKEGMFVEIICFGHYQKLAA